MQYTANDIKAFLGQYENHISHVIVAHTYFRPYTNPIKGKHKNTNAKIQRQLDQTKRDCRYALNIFNQMLYPNSINKAKRHPHTYRPLTFVTIEGAKETLDRSQTIHVNISLGNLPKVLTAEDIHVLFQFAWHTQAKQSNDITVLDYKKGTDNQWTGYSLKEAQQAPNKAWETDGIWDVENCWIPQAALAAD